MQRFASNRYNRIRAAHPDAPEEEILALWTEETYRDSVPPDRLARLCQMIRDSSAKHEILPPGPIT